MISPPPPVFPFVPALIPGTTRILLAAWTRTCPSYLSARERAGGSCPRKVLRVANNAPQRCACGWSSSKLAEILGTKSNVRAAMRLCLCWCCVHSYADFDHAAATTQAVSGAASGGKTFVCTRVTGAHTHAHAHTHCARACTWARDPAKERSCAIELQAHTRTHTRMCTARARVHVVCLCPLLTPPATPLHVQFWG